MLSKAVLSRESEIKIEMRKVSFSGDRSEAGRYAANVRWQGRGKAKDITEELKTFFGTDRMSYEKSLGAEAIRQKLIQKQSIKTGIGDLALEIIADKQGFSGKPKVVSSDEMARLEKDGWTIAYRGLVDTYEEDGTVIKSEELAEQFRTGKYFAGFGTSGNGIYFSGDKRVAETYANYSADATIGEGLKGTILKVAIPPNALMKGEEFEEQIKTNHHRKDRGYEEDSFVGADDIGRLLAARGIKGTETRSFAGGGIDILIVWDRSMLAVEESEQTK